MFQSCDFVKGVDVFCGLLVLDIVWRMAVSEVCFWVAAAATLHTGAFVLQRNNNSLMISCFWWET